MNRSQNTPTWSQIVPRLRAEHPDADCELHFESPFQLLIATILSAQSTDVRVNQVTPELFREYPTPAALAEADRGAVEAIIRSTGFFRQKAKYLQGSAAAIVEAHRGDVPAAMDALTALPGVARKTANVVLGVAFGLAEGIVVDTHVRRVSGRLGLTEHTDPVKIEADLMQSIPQDDWVEAAHLLIFHGRRVCHARHPECPDCPLNDICPSADL